MPTTNKGKWAYIGNSRFQNTNDASVKKVAGSSSYGIHDKVYDSLPSATSPQPTKAVTTNGMNRAGYQKTASSGRSSGGSSSVSTAPIKAGRGSPIGSVGAISKKVTVNAEGTQKNVDEGTDTVYDQMQNKWLNFNDPLMKRVASQANEKSAARGLTNSSIAVGNATGAVVDQAGKFATADAEIYNNRKSENQRSATTLEGQRIGAEAQLGSAEIGADAQIKSSQIGAQAQRDSAAINANAQMRSQQMADQAAMSRLEVDTTSKESIAKANQKAQSQQAEYDRISRERIETMGNTTQERVSQMEQDKQDARQRSDQRNDAYRDMSQGISNIDPGARPVSQDAQANRIIDTTIARLEALGLFNEAVDLAQSKRPPRPSR